MSDTTIRLDARAEILRALIENGELDDAVRVLASGQMNSRAAQPYLEELLELAVDAFRLTGATTEEPIEMAGLLERYLPDYEYRGKVAYRNVHYALTYPAMRAGGATPDLWNDVGYWRSDVWSYAQHAVLAYLRIAADRTGTPVTELASRLQRT